MLADVARDRDRSPAVFSYAYRPLVLAYTQQVWL